MDKTLKFFGALDWLVSGTCLILAVYLKNPWLAASGVLGLVLAYLQPAKKIQAVVAAKFGRKRGASTEGAVASAQDEAFYAEALGRNVPDLDAAPDLPAPAPRSYASPMLGYSRTLLSGNKHNQLKRAHLNLLVEQRKVNLF